MNKLSVVGRTLIWGTLSLTACSGAGGMPDDGDAGAQQDSAALVIGPKPVTNPFQDPVDPTVPALHFGGLWFADPAGGIQRGVAYEDYMTFPSVYDLRPEYVHLFWELDNVDSTKSYLGTDAYSLQLSLDGKTLARGPDSSSGDYWGALADGNAFSPTCGAGKVCVFVNIASSKLQPLWDQVWHFKLKLQAGPVAARGVSRTLSDDAYVYPNDDQTSYFAAKLEPVFHSDRCVTCHSFGDGNKLQAHHVKAVHHSVSVYATDTDHGTLLRCGSGCHGFLMQDMTDKYGIPLAEWMVPGPDMDIDWGTKTASQICRRVRTNLPTPAAMKQHLFRDGRITWAASSSELPGADPNDYGGPLFPDDFEQFVALFAPWIDSGAPCP